jgi:replication fork protection complex subunit Csm3/Swi3
MDDHDLFNFDTDPKDNATTAVDIDAIFEDAENDPELSYKPLAPALDLDALRREADARHAKNIVPLIPTSTSVLPSSFDMGVHTAEKGGEEGEKKEKRRRFKLDEGALLGPNGFPKLIKDTKHFKPKGKGHEVRVLPVTWS